MKGLISAILLVALGCISCTSTTTYSHVEPLSPAPTHFKLRGNALLTPVESTQPLLKWKPVLNHSGTYDVIIYKAEFSFPGGRQDPVPGVEVYYRENLSGTIHKVEEPLEKDTGYLWTVRTRNGPTTGDWATYDFDWPYMRIQYPRKYFLFGTP